MSMTKAQLEQALAEANARAETAESRATQLEAVVNTGIKRVYYRGSLFENQNMRPDRNDPPFTGHIRLPMVCTDCGHRHPVWFDTSLYESDPPQKPTKTPPIFNLSLAVADADFAAKKEAEHQAYWAERNNRN